MKSTTRHLFQTGIMALLSGLLMTSTIAATSIPISSAHKTNTPQTATPRILPPAPDINAKAYVLMDVKSGIILASKNKNLSLPPASLTKLMTLYVVSQALAQGQIKLTDKVHISENAWRRGGSRMFLKEGSNVSVEKLIHGIIVASGNDACVAMAEYLAGNEKSFAALMNQTAKRLGMNNSHFVDSTGLPKPTHRVTPYDLALLTRALINDFPQYYHWYKQKWITYNKIRQPNRNRLLWRDPSVDGLKTGHTQAAGYCLIASGERRGMRLISVVMGTPSDAARSNDSQALLNWGFRFFESHRLFSANTPIVKPRVWLAEEKHVSLGLKKDLYVTIPSGEYAALKATLQVHSILKAPIVRGSTYGTLQITLHGKSVTQAPLIALNNDPQGGLWSRMIDHIELFFKHLF